MGDEMTRTIIRDALAGIALALLLYAVWGVTP